MLSAAMMLTACGAKETAQESGTAQESSETPAQVANETTEEQTADAGGLDEEALVQKAVEAAGSSAEQARYSLADDFDGDGSTEAFVYIGDAVASVAVPRAYCMVPPVGCPVTITSGFSVPS